MYMDMFRNIYDLKKPKHPRYFVDIIDISDYDENIWTEKVRSRFGFILDQPCSIESLLERANLTQKLDELLSQEEIFWRQRARISWMRDGDRNTKFFHRRASIRKAKNRIVKLRDDQGLWQEDQGGIEKVVTDYFSGIYRSQQYGDANDIIDGLEPRISYDMNSILNATFTVEEVRAALFQMEPSKSPGPDGMPPLFFQRF
ncbi:hypothetical protein COP1_039935 [Malus domestica]